jgi:hypothetical protein
MQGWTWYSDPAEEHAKINSLEEGGNNQSYKKKTNNNN